MRRKSKKIITMLLVFMFTFAIPGTMVMAVPKKSGIDSSMSDKLTKAYSTNPYTYKGKKVSYLKGLVKKWAQGKLSKKTLIKKAESLKWKEKSFYKDQYGKYFDMQYMIGSWDIMCNKFITSKTTVSTIQKVGMSPSIRVYGGRQFNCAIAVWSKSKKQYTVYYFGTGFN